MYKYIVIGIAIYLGGDPSLSMLSVFNESKDIIVALALAFIATPWVASQI
jgi:hypothetical protein